MDNRPNRFAAALRSLTERVTLSQLAKDSGVSTGDLSRFRKGQARVSRLALSRLAASLPQDDGVPLVVAYLLDERPEGYETLIQVIESTPRLRDDAPQPRTRWQRALEWVSSQENNPSIADWLIGTAELIQGIQPPAASADSPGVS